MDRHDVAPRDTPRWRAYSWGILAALTCPCHLPLFAAVLSGTAVGAALARYGWIAALTLTILFLLTLARALRAFRSRS
ncbi:MAG: mercury resistance protein [Paraburkholderia sp.]|nr:MAG: mercury resistance protein [Paraburkholderia sp.]